MKSIIRNTFVYGLALFLLAQANNGVAIQGGFTTYLLGGLILSLLFMTLKPVLNILSLPLNLITLGLFSFLTNTIILYLATVFVPQIKISSFVFTGANFAGFIVPQVSFNTFFAFVVSAIFLSAAVGFIEWLIKR
ncbi:MAG: phage holin family protein [Candidatus Levybacteria bacterium]|nr:phage holin family protein [Candidatus Levybacteria bacterium]